MARSDFIEQLVRQAGNFFDRNDFQQDAEGKLRALLQSAFNRMDVVPRDEFEAQQAVLARTRTRLEELEQQVQELERELGKGSGAGSRGPEP